MQSRRSWVYAISHKKEATQAEATVLGNTGMDISAGVINWKVVRNSMKFTKLFKGDADMQSAT